MAAKIRSVGIVRLEPIALDRLGGNCDDSTLDMLLASLAHRRTLADATVGRAAQLAAKRRLGWPLPSSISSTLQVNVSRLMDDLQAEFERVQGANF